MDIQKVRRSIFASEARVLRPLGETVLVTDMNFEFRTTTSGIILPGDDGRDSGIRPRWGRVYAVGPDQRDVQVGQWILIDHGRWTRGIDIIDAEGVRRTVRKVDNKDILMVTDEPVRDDTMSDKVYEK